MGTPRFRVPVLAIAAIVALSFSAPAHADPPALAGSTSIGGERTGYAELTLPRDLRPLNEDQPSVSLEGGGGFLGVALRELPRRLWDDPPTLYALRLGATNDGSVLLSVGNGDGRDSSTLPAGTYRLYLIADQPGRVTLSFPTLGSGVVSLSPDVPTPFQSGPLPTRRNEGGVFSFGQTGSVFSGGLTFVRTTVDDPPPLGATVELCDYAGDQEQAAGSSAYDPGCPGGRSGYKTTVTSSGDGAYTVGFIPGDWRLGLGGNVTTLVGAPGRVNTFGLWMSYDQPPTSSSDQSAGGSFSNSAPPPSTTRESGPIRFSTDTHGSAPGIARLASRRLAVRGRRVAVRLACPRGRPCRGVVRLSGARPARFRLPAGARRTIFALLNAHLASRVAHRGSVRETLRIVAELQAARLQTRWTVTLVRSHRDR